MSTKIIYSPTELRSEIQAHKSQNPALNIGFVPTMGALHHGHQALLQKARLENDLCILSIFVNPTQFNDKEDLKKYPKPWESDLAMAQKIGVDLIFAPEFSQMYPDDYRYQVIEKDFSHTLCGKNRPGHFDGVLSVVMKLFNLVQPTRVYFGEKDFQQLKLIEGMVQAFFMNAQIIRVPTVRETTGLALSSRNLRLTPEEKNLAPELHSALVSSKSAKAAAEKLNLLGFKVDYVEDWDGRRLGAVKLGEVRLIDNVEI